MDSKYRFDRTSAEKDGAFAESTLGEQSSGGHMSQPGQTSALHLIEVPTAHVEDFSHRNPREPRVLIDSKGREAHKDPLLTAEDVARRLNVSKDWVWDHSSRKAPYLPVIRMSDGVLRYRLSELEEFISERERLSALRRRRR